MNMPDAAIKAATQKIKALSDIRRTTLNDVDQILGEFEVDYGTNSRNHLAVKKTDEGTVDSEPIQFEAGEGVESVPRNC